MNILHVCWDLGQGGCQRYLVDLLKAQSQQGIQCEVLILTSEGSLSLDAASLVKKIHYLHMRGGFDVMSLGPLKRFLSACTAELIHSHTDNVLFNLALVSDARPVVYTEHGGRLLKGRLGSKLFYRIFYRRVSRLFAISFFIANVMRKYNARVTNRIKVIHNGVDLDELADYKNSTASGPDIDLPPKPRVGFVGRLVPEKGIDIFIDTARLVLKVMPEVNFVIIGDGPELAPMQELVSRENIGHRIHFLGYRKDARTIIRTFDILYSTSRIDAFGLVPAEAMACGVPCVALENDSAVSEIIRDGTDGIVLKGTNMAAATKAITDLLGNRPLRNKFSTNAIARIETDFSMEKNAQLVLGQYQALTETAGK
ncbi:MAG: glycosyltransferase family 4 protein [Halioglobus sp.]|nr:glycosyltransferase family 4 protein [Halioglobus sp.]